MSLDRMKKLFNIRTLLFHSSVFALSLSLALFVVYQSFIKSANTSTFIRSSDASNSSTWQPKSGEKLYLGRLNTIDEKEYDLKVASGKLLFLMVFSPKCGACAHALSGTWGKMISRLDKSKVAPLLVTVSNDEKNLQKFFNGRIIDAPIVIPAEPKAQQQFSKLPTPSYLIVKDGTILGKWQGQYVANQSAEEDKRIDEIAQVVNHAQKQ